MVFFVFVIRFDTTTSNPYVALEPNNRLKFWFKEIDVFLDFLMYF